MAVTTQRSVSPTGGFVRSLDESGPRFELSGVSEHNRRETPRFAESVARHSLARAGATPRNES
jgi:hypothetical protein